jgi:hypothetical protein
MGPFKGLRGSRGMPSRYVDEATVAD